MSGLDAALYALVHTGAAGDVAFYRRFCVGAERVLELGSGFGRVAFAIAASGPRVTGLELDPNMRALAEERLSVLPKATRARIELSAGDMTSLDLGTRFDRIVIPFSGIYCLLDADALNACLRGVRAHLKEGGRFAFDAYAADRFHEESRPEDYSGDAREVVANIVHEGRALTVYEKSDWVRETQRLDAHYHYVDASGNTVYEHTLGHRYLLRDEIEPTLEAAGLRVLSVSGGFKGAKFDGARALVVVAVRDDAP